MHRQTSAKLVTRRAIDVALQTARRSKIEVSTQRQPQGLCVGVCAEALAADKVRFPQRGQDRLLSANGSPVLEAHCCLFKVQAHVKRAEFWGRRMISSVSSREDKSISQQHFRSHTESQLEISHVNSQPTIHLHPRSRIGPQKPVLLSSPAFLSPFQHERCNTSAFDPNEANHESS